MKLLLISYYYPPMGGAGVQRALKFSKYLRDFGIEPVVLCAFDPAYTHDHSLLAEVPAGIKVLRIEFTPLLQRLLSRRAATAAPAAPAAASAQPSALRVRLRDAALAAHAALAFPDDRAGWARRALAPALALLRDEGISMIFSTAPPMSAHGLAYRLAQASGLPWVADYRDLWTDNPGYAAPAWRRGLDQRTESRWLRRADGVLTVTPSWQQRFSAQLAAQLGAGRPVACIPNGYDEADFAGLQPAERAADDGVFRLVHTGSFYGPRDPAALLEGLALALQARPARALRLRLIGNIGSRFAGPLAAFGARFPGVVEHQAYAPHHEALREMLAADALLLQVGAGHGTAHAAVAAGTLPGKIFEYLRARRPVLLLGDERGDAAQIVRQHAAGWIADETKPERIAQALRQMLSAPPPAVPATAQIERFERRALTGELAAFLRRCASPP